MGNMKEILAALEFFNREGAVSEIELVAIEKKLVVTFRFESINTPNQTNFVFCPELKAQIVNITFTLFQQEAKMRIGFCGKELKGEAFRQYLADCFTKTEGLVNRLCNKIGLRLHSSWYNKCLTRREVFVLHGTEYITVDLYFSDFNDEVFVYKACDKLVEFIVAFADPDYRERFQLPIPEICEMEMVKKKDSPWMTLGEFFWEKKLERNIFYEYGEYFPGIKGVHKQFIIPQEEIE